jgi:putative CRISPR-associated protein (TIGR02619 family)
MPTSPASTLICTLGTSLFYPNLSKLTVDDPDPRRAALAQAFTTRDPRRMAETLAAFDPKDRLCGAEINSNLLLLGRAQVAADPNLYLVHSDTIDGRTIAETLAGYYRRQGLTHVDTCPVADLQDADPQRFRVHGLRNLARVLCRIVRDHSPTACAINATGGYKAQIAVAVLMGQALGLPVYYKHERFDDVIIDIPPMPVALDFHAWERLSGVLFALDREGEIPADQLDDVAPADAEMLESLVERVPIDGVDYLTLSPTGQIFHETFRHRFAASRDKLLPPAAPSDRKREPRIEDGHTRDLRGLRDFLVQLTHDIPQVVHCGTYYFHPALVKPARFWVGTDGLVGQFSDGKGLAKFRVESTADTPEHAQALATVLNEWLEKNR